MTISTWDDHEKGSPKHKADRDRKREDIYFRYKFFFDIAPPFATRTGSQYHNGDEMTTQAFKKKIYEVKVKTYFVLNQSMNFKTKYR